MAAQPAQRLATDTRCAAAVDAHTAELRAQKDMARRAMRATLRAIGKETLEEDSACGQRDTLRLATAHSRPSRCRPPGGAAAAGVVCIRLQPACGRVRQLRAAARGEHARAAACFAATRRALLGPAAAAPLLLTSCSVVPANRSAAALLCPARRRRSGADGVLSHRRVAAADVLSRVLTWPRRPTDALGDLVASTMGILEPRALDLAGLPRENGACDTARCAHALCG